MATWNGSVTPAGSGRNGGRFSWPSSWRLNWRFNWRGLAWGAALVLAPLLVVVLIMPLGDAGAAAKVSPCGKAVGPFTVHGTKVLAKNGSVFISYGMTVSGLQEGNWTGLVTEDLIKIAATANDWCANTIRIQVNQDLLVGPTATSWDPEYMAAIESEVALAESYHLVVVLNDETNFAPLAIRHYQAGPTPGTEVFWKDMTRFYGNDPQVIFDLYNEPRTSVPYMPDSTLWRLWLNGGTFKHVHYAFGMAALAAYVRYTAGSHNLFWIEGPRYSLSFEGMIRYHALIHVSGVVYAIHHAQGQHNVAAWNAAFGYLVDRRHRARGERGVHQLRAAPEPGDRPDPRLLLAQCPHDGPALPELPDLARHRHERVPAGPGLADQFREAPGQSHHDEREDLELSAGPRNAARPERRSADHVVLRAAERLTLAGSSGQARPDQAGLVGDHDQLGPVSRAELGHHPATCTRALATSR